MQLINPNEYDNTISKLRAFFKSKNFIETPVQNRLSILAACEDPRTLSTFNYAGNCWPLPQTGQMWLEYELLQNPSQQGFFCISTSYRNEPNPIPGRHDLIFPMFEFETHGGTDSLRDLETNLLEFLGFGTHKEFVYLNYEDAAKLYNVKELQAEHEEKLWVDKGNVVFIEKFPEYTSPFWNMSRNSDNTSAKIDVLLAGIETIGSAERSSDPEEMEKRFYSISNGMYADILFSNFGKERVKKELNEFLKMKFFPRCGGGIGITRMIRALKLL